MELGVKEEIVVIGGENGTGSEKDVLTEMMQKMPKMSKLIASMKWDQAHSRASPPWQGQPGLRCRQLLQLSIPNSMLIQNSKKLKMLLAPSVELILIAF